MPRQERVDISLEVAHIYMSEYSPALLEGLALELTEWTLPLYSRLHESSTVEVVILIDDYFAPKDMDIEAAGEAIEEVVASSGIPVDRRVLESECVPLAEILAREVIREPREGDGTENRAARSPDDQRWIRDTDSGSHESVGAIVEPVSPWAPKRQKSGRDGATDNVQAKNSRSHLIDLAVEMFKEGDGRGGEVWSCALLAAAWQMHRLGCPTPGLGDSLLSPANRTMSVISPRFMIVETAVNRILRNLRLDDPLFRSLQFGSSMPTNDELVGRIGYLFPPS